MDVDALNRYRFRAIRRWVIPAIVLFPVVFGLFLALPGCSAGPQIPITTPILDIRIALTATDGGTISDAQVWIDRAGQDTKPITTGNEVESDIGDAGVSVPIGGIP